MARWPISRLTDCGCGLTCRKGTTSMKGLYATLLLGAFMVGCAHPNPDISSKAVVSPPKPDTSMLIAGSPSDTETDVWRVRVSADVLQIERRTATGRIDSS